MNSDKTVVVGMSGGVDSSVTAYVLKQQGYNVIGVTMQMWIDKNLPIADGCCGSQAVEDAKKVAEYIGIPLFVLDFQDEFKRNVIDNFTEEYLAGRTPNPCVVCNRYVKWEALLERSKEFNADYVATGHYARVEQLQNGRYAVKNSVTATKDQTYALYNLTQEQLSRTMFPIGEYTKEEIRDIALRAGLPVATKPDSQDICFVPDGDYAGFIEREVPDRIPKPGDFVDKEGKIIGQHKGIIHYTIGQRRGLEIAAGHRIFVTDIRPETNEVVVGENEDLFTTKIICSKVNWMSIEDLRADEKIYVKTKIRYSHAGDMCYLSRLDEDRILCEFEKPMRAPTAGQACVFYDGEHVLGGGTIIK